MNSNSLTIIVPVHNDYETIEACLQSVTWADELLIIDDISESKCIDLCKKYTKTIFTRKLDSFSKQWEYAISKSTSEWVLFIASDEVITQELKTEINQALNLSEYAGFRIPRQDFMYGKWIFYGGFRHDHVRMGRRKLVSWDHRLVHENMQIKGRVGKLKNPVLHFSHKTLFSTHNKFNYYTDLEAERLFKQLKGSNIKTWNLLIKMVYYSFKESWGIFLILMGFRDGMHGIITCFSKGYYYFLMYSKLYEKIYKQENENQIRSELEKYSISSDIYLKNE